MDNEVDMERCLGRTDKSTKGSGGVMFLMGTGNLLTTVGLSAEILYGVEWRALVYTPR